MKKNNEFFDFHINIENFSNFKGNVKNNENKNQQIFAIFGKKGKKSIFEKLTRKIDNYKVINFLGGNFTENNQIFIILKRFFPENIISQQNVNKNQ